MLHLIYKKLKKQKILLLTTSFLALPTLLVSCSDPLQEHLQELEKISKSIASDISKSIADAEKTIPISEQNPEIISNSVLGFNGQKKNPKVAKNRFDVAKHYTEEIPNASFVSGKFGTGKYGLLPYWYFLQSIPKYLENKGFGTRQYNKEEYLKRLDYFDKRLSGYFIRNFNYSHTTGEGGEVEFWKQGLRSQFKKVAEQMKANLDYDKFEDLIDKDKAVKPDEIKAKKILPIIKPELDRYNAQIPKDKSIQYVIVFDFLLANERILPSDVDVTPLSNKELKHDIARYFRDDYYIEKGYKPSSPEKLWYELGWSMLRVQRIINSVNNARWILRDMHNIEKLLFELTDKDKEIDDQLDSILYQVHGAVGSHEVEGFVGALEQFLDPKGHLNLRKDLVFNIDISNNQDDQSLISDFIDYYNQKIAPLIWRINLKREANKKIKTLTKLLKIRKDDYYFNTYLAPLLPEIKDLPDEEDVKIYKSHSEDLQEKGVEGARKVGVKEWGIWLKNYQDKYGIKFKPVDGIDNDFVDHSSLSSVPTPESIEKTSPSSTLNNTQQIPEQTEVIHGESEPQGLN
ncbi:hypothetical protein [Mesomycoplasma ovipneumoniae]|uniref:hypothetical protein n=1 Tax=Mesomycoplasma ovipneumoniae TaxID=29562 RepID=UPI0020CC85BA|nr:hypothetical protein [Mesomycoplasma ovipneumoniae]MCP9306311.1 hypothetical protein [Mesomycoplasma ovipneumoniae]